MRLVTREFGSDVVNPFLGVANHQAVDFWLEHQCTIIELEFNILTLPPVLEKEVFKAVLAKDVGKPVRQLILIVDPGAALSSRAPRYRCCGLPPVPRRRYRNCWW